jgi:hypothetical protein
MDLFPAMKMTISRIFIEKCKICKTLVTANDGDNLKCFNHPWKCCTKGLKDNISLT